MLGEAAPRVDPSGTTGRDQETDVPAMTIASVSSPATSTRLRFICHLSC